MAQSIVFVHGTGVRLPDYTSSVADAEAAARRAGIDATFIECAWGDPLGVQFAGYSLPDPPSDDELKADAEDFARWQWLIADPLFELDKLTIRDGAAAATTENPRVKPQWLTLSEQVSGYRPSLELNLLLERGGLAPLWPSAWGRIVNDPITKEAFEASAHELVEATHALARAVIAQLYAEAAQHDQHGPSRTLRNALFNRLIQDWKQSVYGVGTYLWRMFSRVATTALRRHRRSFSQASALPIGDILLYQSRGDAVRQFIRSKIEGALPPVTVVAHSLGGIAAVDLLALPDRPAVQRLVTAGSQSPLLYEIGALCSMTRPPHADGPTALPTGFPPWLNFYDRNDFLSYVAGGLFSGVVDAEIHSGQPFPDSHSAYFTNHDVWDEIARFMPKP